MGYIPDLTDHEIEQIEKLAMWGLSQAKIASLYKMSKSTLYKKAKQQPALGAALESGYAKGEAQVTETIFEMATNGKNTSATQFWLRCRAGWKETQVVENKQMGIEDLVNAATKKEEAGKVVPIKKVDNE